MGYYFEMCAESLNHKGEELCGDKVEMTRLGDSVIIVLADGLGSGVKANILASLTSKIIISMLREGAEIPEVVETIASTLPVCKERNIAYSTFTILQINGNGQAYVVEFDNPGIVILRRGETVELHKEVREICGKTIKETHVQLKPHDICVMFSDGAVHAGVGNLLNLGWQYPHIVEYLKRSWRSDMTAHSCTKLLLSACDSLYDGQPGDDTTVACCCVCKPMPACIMVGPPVNQNMDKEVVAKLMACPGKKVVCGGTTSQIVSKLTGKPLEVDLEYIRSDVPPVGKIEGIDLVTEGVVTLGKALEIMRDYNADDERTIHKLDSKDGATRLARILLDQCTEAKFLVGRALNPAHQNPDLPIDLNLKLRLVEDLTNEMKLLDKAVTIEYY